MTENDDTKRSVFGELVKERREAKGMSRKELAALVGYDSPNGGITISKIERGLMRASDDRLRRLGSTLEIPTTTIDAFIHGTSGNPLTAAQAKRRNQERALALQTRTGLLQEESKPYYEPLEEVRRKIEDTFLEPFLDFVGSLPDASKEIANALVLLAAVEATAGTPALNEQLTIQRARISSSLAAALTPGTEFAGGAVLGAAGGAAAGAGVAAGTYTAVAAFASASTGTAIASLSGAAASNATLAWLGGGPIAAGGMGVAGGTAVLAGIVMAPAALAAGFMVFRLSKNMQRRAQDEQERLDLAEELFNDSARRVRGSFEWAGAARDFLEGATLMTAVVNSQLGWSEDGYTTPRSWAEMDAKQREAVTRGVQLASVVLSVMPLPVIPNATDEDLDDETLVRLEAKAAEWNTAVLEDARACFVKIMSTGPGVQPGS